MDREVNAKGGAGGLEEAMTERRQSVSSNLTAELHQVGTLHNYQFVFVHNFEAGAFRTTTF